MLKVIVEGKIATVVMSLVTIFALIGVHHFNSNFRMTSVFGLQRKMQIRSSMEV